jgi:uncharacterized protein YoxC
MVTSSWFRGFTQSVTSAAVLALATIAWQSFLEIKSGLQTLESLVHTVAKLQSNVDVYQTQNEKRLNQVEKVIYFIIEKEKESHSK